METAGARKAGRWCTCDVAKDIQVSRETQSGRRSFVKMESSFLPRLDGLTRIIFSLVRIFLYRFLSATLADS